MSYQVENPAVAPPHAPRKTWPAMARGMASRCPACGTGALYTSYLKVAAACPSCRTELHHQRADDAPPYFTMMIVGHVVIGGILAMEKAFAPDTLTHLLIWLPLTVAMSLWLLPRVKGALVGLQWALRMHGFGEGPDPSAPSPDPVPATAILTTDTKRSP